MFLLVLIIFITGVSANENGTKSYRGYQLWQVNIDNLTRELMKELENTDVWRTDESSIDIVLDGNTTGYWEELLGNFNISHEVLITDIQQKLDEQDVINRNVSRRGNERSWILAPTLNEINKFLADVAAANPTVCTLSTIGTTAQRKEIKMLRIASKGNKRHSLMLVEGGMHGREWLSVQAVLYMIESIAYNFTQQPEFIRDKEWHFIPLLNPDGYEYAMTTDKMWLKNRRRLSGDCFGVNLNRNFDHQWCVRASSDTCSPNYCGPVAFSEKETIALRDLLQRYHFRAYVSVHASGNAVIFPWEARKGPFHYTKDHRAVAMKVAKAMHKVDGVTFRPGHVKDFNSKIGTGKSIDWAYFVHGLTHAYIIEARGPKFRDFVLKPHDTMSALKEVRAGLYALSEDLYY